MDEREALRLWAFGLGFGLGFPLALGSPLALGGFGSTWGSLEFFGGGEKWAGSQGVFGVRWHDPVGSPAIVLGLFQGIACARVTRVIDEDQVGERWLPGDSNCRPRFNDTREKRAIETRVGAIALSGAEGQGEVEGDGVAEESARVEPHFEGTAKASKGAFLF